MSDSKPTLYTFSGSVWAAAAELAAHELGYTPAHLATHSVDLLHGANFEPAFLALNPAGTLPTLAAGASAPLTSTAAVVRYLVAHAPTAPSTPAAAATDSPLVAALHADALDPNFSLLSARTPAELRAKAASVPGAFLRGRQAALERLAPPAPPALAPFYAAKLAANTALLALFSPSAPDDDDAAAQAFFAASTAHWARIAHFVAHTLPAHLPSPAAFVGGAPAPRADDFHLAAWLARTVAALGGADVRVLERELGAAVPEAVVAYWRLWAGRASWAAVYAQGLH